MEEVKKKRFQKTKQIFSILGFLFAALFFLFLIYFQFPWKLILFFVFLSCFEYLFPKRHRKRVNVFYGVVLLGAIIWIFLPDQEEGWRPYICYDEIVKQDQERTLPDEKNAAIVYNQLIKSVDSEEFCSSIRGIDDVLQSTFWNDADYPQAANLLEKYSNVIEYVYSAVKLEKCYFPLLTEDSQAPIDYKEVSDLWYTTPVHLAPLRFVGDFLLLSANNDISKNELNSGLKKYFAVLQLSEHLRQQSGLVDVLVGMLLERKTFKCLDNLLITQNLTSEQYADIEENLDNVKYDWSADIREVCEREKLEYKSLMCGIFYQINAAGDIRYNRDPNSTLPSIIHFCPTMEDTSRYQIRLNSHPRAKTYLSKKATKASLLLTNFFVPLYAHKAEKVFDKTSGRFDKMVNPNYKWNKERPLFTWQTVKINFSFFAKMMFEGIFAVDFDRVHDIFLETQANKQATQIIIALKRYKNNSGHWPGSLDVISGQVPEGVLIDPTNGGAFVYCVEGEDFVFYSKGKNGNDEYKELLWRETADPNEIDWSQPRPDDIVIWPPVPKVAKKPAGPMISC